MIYEVKDKQFESLDKARAYAIKTLINSGDGSSVEIYKNLAHTYGYMGYVLKTKDVISVRYVWHANGIWVLNKNGTILCRIA